LLPYQIKLIAKVLVQRDFDAGLVERMTPGGVARLVKPLDVEVGDDGALLDAELPVRFQAKAVAVE
jgi:hypothetical protein